MTTRVRLASPFTDHAVLQRHQPLPVWGWAAPGERIVGTLAGQRREVDADDLGAFRVDFEPLPAGGPHLLTVSGRSSGSVTLHDLLVGEVWICSGQSNMEWPAHASGFSPADLAREIPRLRLYQVPKTTSCQPETTVAASWTPATPAHIALTTGLGLAFARELLSHQDVPVGIINTSWGGTPIEAWTSLPVLEAEPLAQLIVTRGRSLAGTRIDPASDAGKALLAAWERETFHQDPGISLEAAGWNADELDTSAWKLMDLPRTWESTGLNIDGAVWFRREFTLAAEHAGRDLRVRMGAIDDFDQTWCNGVAVGATGKEVPAAHEQLRLYTLPAAVVRPGRNVIAVRVFDHFGSGGIYRGPLAVETVEGQVVARLDGDWQYRVELALEPKASLSPSPFTEDQHLPAQLYHAMIAPLIPYAFRGVLWYQGESNAGRAEQYRRLLPLMISDWRERWGRDFPFAIVQLNAWQPRLELPGPSTWAELREAQTMAAAALPQVWRCVCLDTGDEQDIHPKNKQLIGYRLALLMRRHVYGEQFLRADSPQYASHEIHGGKFRIHLHHAQGLTALGGLPIPGFAIADANRAWHWATAELDGETIVVSLASVPKPTAVRYAWSDFPTVSLVNAAGLPLDAFRTDDWPLATAGIRI
jgi:sialate O-acetylesterase